MSSAEGIVGRLKTGIWSDNPGLVQLHRGTGRLRHRLRCFGGVVAVTAGQVEERRQRPLVGQAPAQGLEERVHRHIMGVPFIALKAQRPRPLPAAHPLREENKSNKSGLRQLADAEVEFFTAE